MNLRRIDLKDLHKMYGSSSSMTPKGTTKPLVPISGTPLPKSRITSSGTKISPTLLSSSPGTKKPGLVLVITHIQTTSLFQDLKETPGVTLHLTASRVLPPSDSISEVSPQTLFQSLLDSPLLKDSHFIQSLGLEEGDILTLDLLESKSSSLLARLNFICVSEDSVKSGA